MIADIVEHDHLKPADKPADATAGLYTIYNGARPVAFGVMVHHDVTRTYTINLQQGLETLRAVEAKLAGKIHQPIS
jgi:hypothetical protein